MMNKFFYMNYSKFNYDTHILSLINIKKSIFYIQIFNKFIFKLFPKIIIKYIFFNLKNFIIFKDNLKYDKIINIKNYKFLIFNFIYLFETNLNTYFYHIFYSHNYKNQKIFFDFYSYVNKICDKNMYLNWFQYSKLLIYRQLLCQWFYQTNINKFKYKFNSTLIMNNLNYKLKNKFKYNILLSFFNKYKKKKIVLYNKIKKTYKFNYFLFIKKINQFYLKFFIKKNKKFSKYAIFLKKRFKRYFGFKGLRLKSQGFYNNNKNASLSNIFLLANFRQNFSFSPIINKTFYNF
jgi:hypothetical protein